MSELEPPDKTAVPAPSQKWIRSFDGSVAESVLFLGHQSLEARARDLEMLSDRLVATDPSLGSDAGLKAVGDHVRAARASVKRRGGIGAWLSGRRKERAISQLDAAEVLLLDIAPNSYVVGQLPSLLSRIQRRLEPENPRRQALENIVNRVNMNASERRALGQSSTPSETVLTVNERFMIADALRAVNEVAARERLRVRSFRNIVVAATLAMTALAVAVAVIGALRPSAIPLCFTPAESGEIMIVCPTIQSPLPVGGQSAQRLDIAVKQNAGPWDLLAVEAMGLVGAVVIAATAIRNVGGWVEPHGVPLAVAALKLPTGAVTAFLGLLLLRAQFVPGFGTLSSSAQILVWALVFGFAQQIFTRFVDQQAYAVLGSERGGVAVVHRASDKALMETQQQVVEAVNRSVQDALSPPLVDVEGQLSAAWTRAENAPWELSVTVRTGATDSSDRGDRGSRPFRLSGGQQRTDTELEVLVDLPGHVVDTGQSFVNIPTEGGRHIWTGEVRPPVDSPPPEAWVSVYTYGRFLQAVSVAHGQPDEP